MNKHTVLAGLLALVSLDLVACAAPESAAEGSELALAATDDHAVIDNHEATGADALLAGPDRMKARTTLGPSLTSPPISPAHRSGAIDTPVPLGIDLTGTFAETCRVRYSCDGKGTLVVHREGAGCILGNTILRPGWAEEYREEPLDLQEAPAPKKWLAEAQLVEVSFADALASSCERND